MRKSASDACLDVANDAHARIRVRIGNVETVLEEGSKAVRFHLDPTGGSPGVVATNLSEAGSTGSRRTGPPLTG